MKDISIDISGIESFLDKNLLNEYKSKFETTFNEVILSESDDEEAVLGWMRIDEILSEEIIQTMEKKAKQIREDADIFILIGVGGSNQGSRAVLKMFQNEGPEVIYAGNNLSPKYLNEVLQKIKNKSVYVNIIAKNFATLEPGMSFRVIRQYLEKTYGLEEAAKRIIATGSPNNSSLQQLAKNKGYLFIPFPIAVGGRFSIISPVELFPIAVGGIDIRQIIQGAEMMKTKIISENQDNSDAFAYAIIRNILYEKEYAIELMAFFEPALTYFGKWWVQLFGESEGKDGKGLFPSMASYSEDLHSIGQWIQSGKRNIFETFINIEEPVDSLIIKADKSKDYFDYLDEMDLDKINRIAYEATKQAHLEGGVPCLTINVPKLSPVYIGQLFFFYEMVCYLSAKILGVNPFDQPGVEAYKNHMFSKLKE